MPDQRDPNKRSCSMWVDKDIVDILKERKAAERRPLSFFIEEYVRRGLEAEGYSFERLVDGNGNVKFKVRIKGKEGSNARRAR